MKKLILVLKTRTKLLQENKIKQFRASSVKISQSFENCRTGFELAERMDSSVEKFQEIWNFSEQRLQIAGAVDFEVNTKGLIGSLCSKERVYVALHGLCSIQ